MPMGKNTPQEVAEAAQAVRQHIRDLMNAHGASLRYADVTSADPINLSVHGLDLALSEADGDVIIGDAVRLRDSRDPIVKGDSLLVAWVPSGETGSGDWHALDVVGESDLTAEETDPDADLFYSQTKCIGQSTVLLTPATLNASGRYALRVDGGLTKTGTTFSVPLCEWLAPTFIETPVLPFTYTVDLSVSLTPNDVNPNNTGSPINWKIGFGTPFYSSVGNVIQLDGISNNGPSYLQSLGTAAYGAGSSSGTLTLNVAQSTTVLGTGQNFVPYVEVPAAMAPNSKMMVTIAAHFEMAFPARLAP